MAYENYKQRFKSADEQYNIMALVGNGFDIQALSGLNAQADTRYESFYHYLKYRNFDSSNRILAQMEDLRGKAENWSDIESAIGKLLESRSATEHEIAADLLDIQREFSSFLDQVVTPEVLTQLGERAVNGRQTMVSFVEFLGDIDDPDEYRKMSLPKRINIGHLLNFKFVNFNYTTLLDDFVYLDQEQFKPHPYKGSDRNHDVHPNPRGFDGAKERKSFTMVSYLVTDVVHPHGIQSIPRSLLFGIDEAPVGRGRELSKPYWAQNNVKYGPLFPDTDLFIIFGCSLGETDRWWWRSIVDGLKANDNADLIIYKRRGANETRLTPESIREQFAEAAGYSGDVDVMDKLREKARVVLYDDDTERAWLNTNASEPPSWAHESMFADRP